MGGYRDEKEKNHLMSNKHSEARTGHTNKQTDCFLPVIWVDIYPRTHSHGELGHTIRREKKTGMIYSSCKEIRQ